MKYYVAYTVTSFEDTFKRAQLLLYLAHQTPAEDERARETLSVCCVLVLASCLEQAIAAEINSWGNAESIDRRIPVQRTSFASLEVQTLRNRMTNLPIMKSDGNLMLNGSTETQRLHQLVSARNALHHIPNSSGVMEIDESEVDPDSGTIQTRMPVRKDPWHDIDTHTAQGMLNATRCYLDEVIQSTELRPGKMLRMT